MKTVSEHLLKLLIDEALKKESEKTGNQNTLKEIIPNKEYKQNEIKKKRNNRINSNADDIQRDHLLRY